MLALISIETNSINIELWLYWTNRLSHDDNRQFRCRCSKSCIRACRKWFGRMDTNVSVSDLFSLSLYRFESTRFSPNSVMFIYSFTRYRCIEVSQRNICRIYIWMDKRRIYDWQKITYDKKGRNYESSSCEQLSTFGDEMAFLIYLVFGDSRFFRPNQMALIQFNSFHSIVSESGVVTCSEAIASQKQIGCDGCSPRELAASPRLFIQRIWRITNHNRKLIRNLFSNFVGAQFWDDFLFLFVGFSVDSCMVLLPSTCCCLYKLLVSDILPFPHFASLFAFGHICALEGPIACDAAGTDCFRLIQCQIKLAMGMWVTRFWCNCNFDFIILFNFQWHSNWILCFETQRFGICHSKHPVFECKWTEDRPCNYSRITFFGTKLHSTFSHKLICQ